MISLKLTDRKFLETESGVLAALFQICPLAVYVTDLNGVVRLWNPEAERVFGWKESEILDELFPQEDERIRSILFAGTARNVEVTRRRKDGVILNLSLHTTPVKNAKGEVIGIMVVGEDISDRKREESYRRADAFRSSFLANVSERLAQTLDFRNLMQVIGESVVPRFADGCVIYLVEEDRVSDVRWVTASEKAGEIYAQLNVYYPSQENPRTGIYKTLKTRKPQIYRYPGDERWKEIAEDDYHLELLRSLGIKSYLTVPMIARGELLGAFMMFSTSSDRHYSDELLDLA